ncbi:MAG: hypothetical protein ACK4JD_07920, partial [Thermoflexales bacterium]
MCRIYNALGWLTTAALFASQLWLFKDFSIDDAFITFRYVRQFVAGNGLVYNIGERVEGYSNFLWVVLLSPAAALSIDLLTAARVLSVALSVGALLLTYRLASASPVPILAPVMLAAYAPFAAWTMGGLETPLFAFLAAASAYAFIREEERGHGVASGLLFGLLALARPEGILFFGLAVIFRLWRLWMNRAAITPADRAGEACASGRVQWRPSRQDMLRLIGFAALFIPHFLWRLSYYGQP